MKRTLLVDADVLIYRAASANQSSYQWSEDVFSVRGDFAGASKQLDDEVESLMADLKADHCVMALSNYESPWRKAVMPTYKSNRKPEMKPILLKPLRQYVHEKYEAVERPTLEGDDVLGILMTAPGKAKEYGERICCSIDKDMKTVPGLHFRMCRAGEEVVAIDEGHANYNHMMQALTGDRTDGYPGCPGVGPVSAEKVLAGTFDYADMWPLVVAAYEKKGLSEEDALRNARVARICRVTDYDFVKKEVILWQPT
jgi:5'-3' exonuclease